jgi:hypothetical protein
VFWFAIKSDARRVGPERDDQLIPEQVSQEILAEISVAIGIHGPPGHDPPSARLAALHDGALQESFRASDPIAIKVDR